MDLLSAVVPGLALSDSNVSAASVRRRTWLTRFLPEKLYEYLAKQTELTLISISPMNPRVLEIPPSYTSVWPLDTQQGNSAVSVTGSYGYVTAVYKVISRDDAMPYALRRVENVRAPAQLLQSTLASWRRVAHPGIVALRSAETHGGALFFAHDYFPDARNLKDCFLDAVRSGEPAVDEATMWSFLCQIVGALSAVHSSGLSFRGLQATHVLFIPGSRRVRLAGAGILDVLESDSKKSVAEHQAADLAGLGSLMLRLATGGSAVGWDVSVALQSLQHYSGYSVELQGFLHRISLGGVPLSAMVTVRARCVILYSIMHPVD